MAKAKTNPTPSFEEALLALEQLVHTMEEGSLSLDEALLAYEKGVQLTRLCQASLSQAEQRVRVVQQDGTENLLAELPEGLAG
ncbi:exodeoxyribonuclease VII small subunit [Thiofilum flexile]|uniref:exodeoxyribonuclease VII small subunit n=1 Tax=Thiofilum flexile TaxID=125627 RepID=UPI000370791A|nr:exodeoxyribonuclease VII small subunit [Thiofilum flexile]